MCLSTTVSLSYDESKLALIGTSNNKSISKTPPVKPSAGNVNMEGVDLQSDGRV